MTSVVSQERLSGQLQAGAAGALILGHAGANSVGAVTADEPPILISDHRPERDARHAMWAADRQGCVSRQSVLLHTSKGSGTHDSRHPCPVILMKTKGSSGAHDGIEPKPRRNLGRSADRRADQAGYTNQVFRRSANGTWLALGRLSSRCNLTLAGLGFEFLT
jgi:hypothetical protein